MNFLCIYLGEKGWDALTVFQIEIELYRTVGLNVVKIIAFFYRPFGPVIIKSLGRLHFSIIRIVTHVHY